MGTTQRVRAGWFGVALGLCLVPVASGYAQVNTERPGSLLIFPKVVNDGTRTTVVQISNTTNSLQYARCFYLNGQLGGNGAPRCTETDFYLSLSKQQPTFWSVAKGRPLRSFPGLDPGPVPPVPPGFTGALICASVARDGTPIRSEALTGVATLQGPGDNSSKYGAVSFRGSGTNNGDNNLVLDDAASNTGKEYNACPGAVRVNFPNPVLPDPVIVEAGNWGQCAVTSVPCTGDPACVQVTPGTCDVANALCTAGRVGAACTTDAECDLFVNNGPCLSGICSDGTTRCNASSLTPTCPGGGTCSALTGSVTNITLLPCNINLDTLQPTRLAVSFDGTDGTERTLSGSKTLSCWESFTLEARPGCTTGWGHACLTPPTTDYATVNLKSTAGGPFVGVAETFHLDTAGNAASAGVNVFVAAGTCSGSSTNLGQACNNDSDCVVCGAGGTCVPAGAGSCAFPSGGAVIQLPTN